MKIDRKQIPIRMSREIFEILRKGCFERNMSINAYVLKAIIEQLKIDDYYNKEISKCELEE